MTRRIDHLVIAVRDLEEAAAFYGRLGFRVGGRNRHPWGTENRLVQLPGSFLELISVGEGASIAPHEPGTFSFGAFVRDYLEHREGLAMLVLASDDAEADAKAFADAGIGAFAPFRFARRGRRPDGTETEVAFTLAFADAGTDRAGFFVCQHRFPENFWDPAFQQHENRAVAIPTVALAAPEPHAMSAFLSAFTGAQPSHPAGDALSFPLDGAQVDVLNPDDAAEAYGSVEAELDRAAFVAFSIRVEDIARQARLLDAAGIPHTQIGSRSVVPASAAFGVAIAFEAE